jgi:hypothetical protein
LGRRGKQTGIDSVEVALLICEICGSICKMLSGHCQIALVLIHFNVPFSPVWAWNDAFEKEPDPFT